LSEAEAHADTLRAELEILAAAAEGLFQPHSVEWVTNRVAALDSVLQMERIGISKGRIALRPSQPAARRVYQPANLP
jgi:hypothetical protein